MGIPPAAEREGSRRNLAFGASVFTDRCLFGLEERRRNAAAAFVERSVRILMSNKFHRAFVRMHRRSIFACERKGPVEMRQMPDCHNYGGKDYVF